MKRKEREWLRHCKRMQNELNNNNWERHGFYVDSKHDVVLDWRVNLNFGYFTIGYEQI